MSELILNVDGRNYTGFKEVTAIRSIESGPHQFELKVAPDLDTDAGIYRIEDGMSCAMYVDDDLLTTGYVDSVGVNYDAQSHEISVAGRSKAGDLADCSTTGMQIKAGQTLLSAAKTLCDPFGISVSVDSSASDDANKPFATTDLALDAGQPVWEFLEDLARVRAVLLISDADGNLVITRTGGDRADTGLVLGQNIKAAQGFCSHRSLFSKYIVSGQQSLWTSSDAGANSQSLAEEDGDAKRYRPMVILSDSPADNAACQARAKWQRRVNYGRSRSIQYTVQGWRQTEDGRLWMPNELINVTDERSHLDSAERLITSVQTTLSVRSGKITTLSVMPKAAFDLLAQPASSGGLFA